MNQIERILKYIKMTTGVILIICLIACGAVDQQESGENPDSVVEISRVINGDDAVHGEFPWQVQIGHGNQPHICGGALITDSWVVTAGHCAKGMSPNRFKIVLGDHQLSSNEGTEQLRSVDEVVIYPDFILKQPPVNDIALLRLSSPVTLNKYVQTISLPEISDDSTGLDAVVTGWGWPKAFSGWWGRAPDLADILQEGIMPIRENKACEAPPRFPRSAIPVEICAGYLHGDQGTCHGDSGGPLAVFKNGKWTIVGVVSWGQGGSCNTYGVFTRVSSFVYWINETIGFPQPGNGPHCWDKCLQIQKGCNTEIVCQNVCIQ